MNAVVRRRVLVSALLVAAGVAIVAAFQLTRTNDQQPVFRDAAVLSVQPTPDSHVLRQTTIGYQLDPAYVGVLSIDGAEIAADQLEHTSLTNEIAYTPAADKQTGVLRTGRHCASGEFWKRTADRSQSRQYGWCFFVQ